MNHCPSLEWVIFKFARDFEICRQPDPEDELANHNIITCLTKSLLSKQNCSAYFEKEVTLLKQAYIHLKKQINHVDRDGEELEVLLQLDNQFFVEHLNQKMVNYDRLPLELKILSWILSAFDSIYSGSFVSKAKVTALMIDATKKYITSVSICFDFYVGTSVHCEIK